MAFYDLPLEELLTYRPEHVEPADFDAFWKMTLETSSRFPLEPRFEPIDDGLKTIESFDVTFNGYNGQPIKGWLLLPRIRSGLLPCVVEYIGYGGGRGFTFDWLQWPSAGYALLVMDTRGQGSVWRKGDTPDLGGEDTGGQVPGFVTRGILHPETYYYRRLMTDAVRAVEAARSHPAVDPSQVLVSGGSQGGGLAIAVAGLDTTVRAALPEEPFLCHFRRATQIVNSFAYGEIIKYCKVHRDKIETVFQTLAYFDGMNFAARAQAPALFSVALMDETCPPSTVFAAYNFYAGPKEIKVYEYNDHEGGDTFEMVEKLKFLKRLGIE